MIGVQWAEVWDVFDRQLKKIIGIGPVAENDGVDVFEAAGVAAE